MKRRLPPGTANVMGPSALRADARFRQSVAQYCETMVEPAPAGWPVRKLLNQLERYYSAYMLIGQYYGWSNHGAAVPIETLHADRRQKILRPAESLIREVGRSCAAFVHAYDLVVGSALALPFEQDAGVLGEMIFLSAARVQGAGTVIAEFPTVLRLAGYDSGYPLLVALILSHYRRAADKEGISLTHGALAERFQVSESHVGNVLGHMRQARALLACGSQELSVTEELVDEFEHWCAAEMSHYAELAQRAMAYPQSCYPQA